MPKNIELYSIEECIQMKMSDGSKRHEAIIYIASKLETSVGTVYRWIKDGDHFLHAHGAVSCSVYKNVKNVG